MNTVYALAMRKGLVLKAMDASSAEDSNWWDHQAAPQAVTSMSSDLVVTSSVWPSKVW